MTSAVPSACDEAAAAAGTPSSVAFPRLTLTGSILASSLAFVDGSVTNVALPAIARSYAASAEGLQWTVEAYLLPLSALLLVGGAAGDQFGRRRLLIAGIALFVASSVACAAASGLGWLLAARAAQGVGAAMLMPNSLAILGAAFSGPARGRAIGTWAAAGAIASAIGPPLGGWLVGAIGWRAIFLLNVPLGTAAMFVAWRYMPGGGDDRRAPPDAAGAMLATGALGALTWGLTLWSSRRAFDVRSGAGLAAGALLLAAFVMVERRRGERAMMPLGLFGSRAFVGLSLFTFLLYGALGGLLVLVPFVLIRGGGYSPLQAGMALLPFPFIIGGASRFMGLLAERIGPRLPLTIGPAVTAAGFVLMARADPGASYWSGAFPGMATIALGMAGAVAPLTTAVLSSAGPRHTGTASGFNSAISRTGGLIATALTGVVIARDGAAMLDAFHAAALAGAAAALAAAVTAWATLGRLSAPPGR